MVDGLLEFINAGKINISSLSLLQPIHYDFDILDFLQNEEGNPQIESLAKKHCMIEKQMNSTIKNRWK